MSYEPQPPQSLPPQQYPQQQPYQQQPYPQQQAYPQQSHGCAQSQPHTLALVGFIMAIGSVVLTFVPFVSVITVLSTPAALIISIIANSQIKNSHGQLTGKGYAVAGIWISAVGMALGLLILIFAGALIFSVLGSLSP